MVSLSHAFPCCKLLVKDGPRVHRLSWYNAAIFGSSSCQELPFELEGLWFLGLGFLGCVTEKGTREGQSIVEVNCL